MEPGRNRRWREIQKRGEPKEEKLGQLGVVGGELGWA